ncbi:GNAT family N-acetyltransferase [Ohtaekwangia koreensis]|uniref:Protein N-acetyltransferase, RimJ/RimL family n=1 Tax=Ohtaekwangia koreensis TaxID=688867 RepID=A0A1T5MFP1_9BACT|nr:GNAT family protein [Ohtaekwangia koreensis]SKC86728.1 Protein N-acetyltransferase, RimJ/RimL family [Ohtaekwangia koreensis]
MIRLDLPDQFLTERLVLQRLRYEDAEEIFYTYTSKPEATRYVSWRTHQTMDETRSFLQYAIWAWKEGTDYTYTIRLKADGRLIGSVGIINENGKIQFGYILSPNYWNKGYTTEACKETMQLLLKQRNVYRIGTYVDLENIASIRVLEKCGLIEEARLTNWMRFPNQNNRPKDCAVYVLPFKVAVNP